MLLWVLSTLLALALSAKFVQPLPAIATTDQGTAGTRCNFNHSNDSHLGTIIFVTYFNFPSEILKQEACMELDEAAQIIKSTFLEIAPVCTHMQGVVTNISVFNLNMLLQYGKQESVTVKKFKDSKEIPRKFEVKPPKPAFQRWSSRSFLGLNFPSKDLIVLLETAVIAILYYQVICHKTKLFLGAAMTSIKLICLRAILFAALELESSSFLAYGIPRKPKLCVQEGYRCWFSYTILRRTCSSCTFAVDAGGESHNSSCTVQMIGGMHSSDQVVKVPAGDVNLQDSNGYTALHLAAQNKDTPMAMILFDSGADANLQDLFGQTALMLAAENEDTEMALLLLDRGADANLQDSGGGTALLRAAQNMDMQTATLLLNRGADANCQDSNGATALMMAAQNKDTQMTVLLLESGADVNLKAIGGLTALRMANENGASDITQMLKSEERKKIAQKEEQSSFPFYVMPRKNFKELCCLITHEIALRNGLLVILMKIKGKLYDENGFEVDRSQIVFFSQRWFSYEHPDNKDNMKLGGCQTCLGNIELLDVSYVWFDLLCIPQANDKQSKKNQQNAINSLPFYVRNSFHFVTLLAETGVFDDVTVLDETTNTNVVKKLDKGSIEMYDSRGWCRIEKLAASSPPIDFSGGKFKRLPAAKMWQYHINSGKLYESSFAFATEHTVDPLKGNFTGDVEKEKKRVAPMVLQLCAYIELFSGVEQIRNHGAEIQILAERYAGAEEGYNSNSILKLIAEKEAQNK